MSERKYWGLSHMAPEVAVDLEWRAGLAWELIRRFGVVAASRGPEDSAGRAVLDLLPPGEVVARAFAIADLFAEEAARRGDLREVTEADVEAAFRRGGELSRARTGAEYPRGRWRDNVEDVLREAAEGGTLERGA